MAPSNAIEGDAMADDKRALDAIAHRLHRPMRPRS